jgi:hypothetical protein
MVSAVLWFGYGLSPKGSCAESMVPKNVLKGGGKARAYWKVI